MFVRWTGHPLPPALVALHSRFCLLAFTASCLTCLLEHGLVAQNWKDCLYTLQHCNLCWMIRLRFPLSLSSEFVTPPV